MTPDTLLHFWFEEIPQTAWWEKSPAFDATLRERFGTWLQAAALGELSGWRSSIRGRLTEVLLLDQLPRNIHRDMPAAFATDGMALVLAQEAVRLGLATELPPVQRAFLYLPYMHSESRRIHEEAVKLFSEPGLEFNLDFEFRHKAIIDRFGRYPHRNTILGRESSAEELAFLKEPGSSF